ncbi:Hypothetical predicted protein, partial [Podarcis lilfordi]
MPGLVQPQASTFQQASRRDSRQDPSREDSRQQQPLSLPKKKSLADSGPAFPELSDENLEYLLVGKKMLGGRTVREALEMMDETEILDTIFQHLQPAPQ